MNLVVLGATGSIGASTLDVAARHPERYRVFALTAHGSADQLARLCRRHRPRYAVLSSAAENAELRRAFAEFGTELVFGAGALEALAAHGETDAVMAGIVGAAGLASTLAAVRAGKRVLLANKEALVMAGPLVMRAARESGAQLLPVDSEHNAVFQCFSDAKAVRKVVLTASGGPFRAAALDSLKSVTPEQACAHPNWVMGRKISVDSATMMNKGLELIEARHLFGLGEERIEILIHPESIVHSLVAFEDGSMLAQLGQPDMRIPIAYTLGWPDRIRVPTPRLDLAAVARLTFATPDAGRFPALRLARDALREGGAAPTVLNAANEVAVGAFLAGRLGFLDIAAVVERVLERSSYRMIDELDFILSVDADARRHAEALIAGWSRPAAGTG